MDDFLLRAAAGGIGVALAAGPLGCVVVWRRMAYFGSALSHAALLGVALGLLLELNLALAVLALSLLLALALAGLEGRRWLAVDTLLGIMAHAALALGILVMSLLQGVRLDLMAYLFGDVLAVSSTDLWTIYALAALICAGLRYIWRDLVSITVDPDLAAVEGVAVARVRLVFVLLLAALIAIGMKVVGVLLVVSLLIIPAAAARALSDTPERMALLSIALGAAAVGAGLGASLAWDLPSGPAIVSAATLLFLAASLRRARG